MTRLTFITLLSIITLVMASLVHWQSTQVDEPIVQQKQDNDEPDFYMLNAKTTQFNSAGNIDHHLNAESIKHFPIGDFVLAANPDITLIRNDRTEWNITAKQGRMTEQNDIIELRDEVEVQRDTPPNVLNLSTNKLTLVASKDLAYTDQDVTIIDSTTHIKATGMNAFIEENRIKFLSNVRVTHDPIKVN